MKSNQITGLYIQRKRWKAPTPVSLNGRDAAIEQVLVKCFNNQPVSYNINKSIIIVKALIIKNKPANSPSYHLITGSVLNEKGEVLPGATVGIKGNTQATATDELELLSCKLFLLAEGSL